MSLDSFVMYSYVKMCVRLILCLRSTVLLAIFCLDQDQCQMEWKLPVQLSIFVMGRR